MTIYPAIDLRGGKCVRLFQGLASEETIYFEDPLDAARKWIEVGAKYMHLVDLDGAFSGGSANLDAVQKIAQETQLRVQLGGGMRDDRSVKEALALGLNRVIIGTRACTDPQWVGELVEEFGPDKIVVGIDAKDGLVATKGWVETTEIEAIDLAQQMQDLGARWIIHTDVATDGAMKGPNLEAQQKIAEAVPDCQIIASGGVTSYADIDDLRELSEATPNIEGVIIGRALYEGTIELSKIL
ncbi:MAG: 1-(5-phosphoribosyl)-5-[(5-phosphoribosylamino)methylideneamino]imidazole-4-carboxamide isomerase [Verrucomicrobia bacterium]|nr:1-(5-phosphoribosyl)-5-[(5-phosphoribosylamino)methylideneamino]imidazole-4-carboxamide isomerase [Verrucomicrobiota bacterium]